MNLFSWLCLSLVKFIPHILLSSCDILRALSLSLTTVPNIDHLFRWSRSNLMAPGRKQYCTETQKEHFNIKEKGFRKTCLPGRTGSLVLLKDWEHGCVFLGKFPVFYLNSSSRGRMTHDTLRDEAVFAMCSLVMVLPVSALTLNRWSQQRQTLHPLVLPHASCRRVCTCVHCLSG